MQAQYLVLLHARVMDDTNIVVDIKVEQGTRLASRLAHDEVVEAMVLRDDEILLDIQQVVGTEVAMAVVL